VTILLVKVRIVLLAHQIDPESSSSSYTFLSHCVFSTAARLSLLMQLGGSVYRINIAVEFSDASSFSVSSTAAIAGCAVLNMQ
jgi:hypothetical protein